MKIISLPNNTVPLAFGFLWDGIAREATGPGTLVIHAGRVAVEHYDPTSSAMDLSAFTLLPALIDCHVHMMLPYSGEISPKTRAGCLLKSGVAAVRDAGSKCTFLQNIEPLTCVYTGVAISRAGYYGENLGIAVSGAESACRVIDQLSEQGINQVKLVASGIFSFNHFGKTGPLPFTTEELKQITAYAAGHGLPVMAHASGDDAIRRCLDAGIGCIEHGYFISDEALRQMAAQNTFWVPTLSPVAAWLDTPVLFHSLTSLQQETVYRSLEQQKAMVAKASALGISIGAGTDAGAPGVEHGVSLVREIELLHECGLSLREAITAATKTASAVCGLSDLGTLTSGKKAAIAAYRENPLENLQALYNPALLLLPS